MKALSFLDLVIGMVFIYLLFSIACSTLWEMVANLRNLRGKMLRNWFLTNFRRGEDTSAGEKILSHPLIRGLEGPKGKPPAYISPRIFSEVITDLVLHEKPKPQDEPEKAAGIRMLREKLSVTNLLPDAMQRVFVQHAEESEGVKGVKKGIGEWYGEVQVQLTAAYKRKVQRWILAISVALVVAVNADTFRLASWLWTSEESRVALVKEARGFLADELVARQVEAIRTTQLNPMAPQSERKSATALVNATKTLEKVNREVQDAGMPVGWDSEAVELAGFWAIIKKIAGLLLTAFAVSQGAPFWFDLLNKIVVLRSPAKKVSKN